MYAVPNASGAPFGTYLDSDPEDIITTLTPPSLAVPAGDFLLFGVAAARQMNDLSGSPGTIFNLPSGFPAGSASNTYRQSSCLTLDPSVPGRACPIVGLGGSEITVPSGGGSVSTAAFTSNVGVMGYAASVAIPLSARAPCAWYVKDLISFPASSSICKY